MLEGDFQSVPHECESLPSSLLWSEPRPSNVYLVQIYNGAAWGTLWQVYHLNRHRKYWRRGPWQEGLRVQLRRLKMRCLKVLRLAEQLSEKNWDYDKHPWIWWCINNRSQNSWINKGKNKQTTMWLVRTVSRTRKDICIQYSQKKSMLLRMIYCIIF